MRSCVIGAGFAGLAAALDLRRAGHEVVLYEAADRPGGLAAGFRDASWDWPLECFYHHLFATDDDILALVRETGFGDKVLVRRPITAFFHEGRAHALDGPGPVLRFSGIPPADRLRMGLVIAYLKARRDWRSLEQVSAAEWARRWMGRAAYDVVWQPLLQGKFGDRHEQIPMSWLWARLHKRSMRLIYFDGGFPAFADHLAARLTEGGADLRFGETVRSIEPAGEGLHVTASSGTERFDRVVATIAPHAFAEMAAGLPEPYRQGLARLRHLGAVVAVMALDRRFMESVYWLSMDKRQFPFLAVVEHTNFMPRERYGGEHILYVGDYLSPEDRLYRLPDEELLREWMCALAPINPAFSPSWVRRSWVFRSEYAQPVVPLGFSRQIPPIATGVPGLYLASMSQVYPWDRGTNYAVAIGREAAALAAA